MVHLEVWKRTGPELVELGAERITLGKSKDNRISISGDAQLSRLHAAFERYEAGWAVRDLGSRNGTFVNGERIWTDKALRSGDEIRIGKTRVVFRGDSLAEGTKTELAATAPELTRRERDILMALCRPVLSGDVFTEPASIREIAEELVVTEAAVKQHLTNLYAKFELHAEDGERRRVRLANEAIQRGAVRIPDLADPAKGGD